MGRGIDRQVQGEALIVEAQVRGRTGGRRRVATAILIAVSCGGVWGCALNSQLKLAAEANRLATPGSKATDAVARLTHAGFRCDPDRGHVTCTRPRAYYAVSTCVQRINLMLDESGARVEGVDTPRVACAGL